MSKNLICLVGESGSGKDTIAEILKLDYGLTSIKSYTTRPKRYNGENTHIFVDDKAFSELKDVVAYTEFNGYKYCATAEQVENNDIYVIDPEGIKYFREHYKGNKDIVAIYIKVKSWTRFWRMIHRGDGFKSAWNRIKHDKVAFKDAINITDLTCHDMGSYDIARIIASLAYYKGDSND